MLGIALVSLVLHNSMRLHHSQCFHCVKTDVHKTGMLVLALVSLVMHNSMQFHRSQCFHCVKTDNVHQTRF